MAAGRGSFPQPTCPKETERKRGDVWSAVGAHRALLGENQNLPTPRSLSPFPVLSGPGAPLCDICLLLVTVTVTVKQEGWPHGPSEQGCACRIPVSSEPGCPTRCWTRGAPGLGAGGLSLRGAHGPAPHPSSHYCGVPGVFGCVLGPQLGASPVCSSGPPGGHAFGLCTFELLVMTLRRAVSQPGARWLVGRPWRLPPAPTLRAF